ncbi:Uncharacterised protein [Mycobacteroides abscessus subsp. abscessus]|nr:Uncharacterised protein [Mycobacteroides abscessus subsp. abscessus]
MVVARAELAQVVPRGRAGGEWLRPGLLAQFGTIARGADTR